MRGPDGVRRQQAAGPWHASGVRGGHQRAGLHARVAVLHRAMGAGSDARHPGALTPGQGSGPGWAKLAAAVAAEVPPAEIETIYLFRPIKREGREWGTAVVTRRNPEGRVRGYTAKYMLVVPGKEPGETRPAVEEGALQPAESLAHGIK